MARILVSMPDEFLNKIDAVADEEQRTRSELIREALRSYLRSAHTINSKRALKNADILDDLLN